jgi:hypothetical protein
MPIYESTLSYDQMVSTARNQVCAQCGSCLNVGWSAEKNCWMLRCQHLEHDTVTKRFKSEYDKNIENEMRRFKLEQQTGSTAVALRKYEGVTSLTKEGAKEIILTLWPEAEKASPVEVYKAMSICVQYGLNPLMNHVFLIPFDKYEGTGDSRRKVGTTYATVLGIGANRLIASRKHSYSYLDDTPRIMTRQEQEKIYGEVDDTKIHFITRLKDTRSGAEASGYGEWPKLSSYGKPNQPKGTEKGNSMANMSAIRSERQALARLYPADMPGADIPVVDENYEPRLASSVVAPEIIDGEVVEPSKELPEGDIIAAMEKEEADKKAKEEVAALAPLVKAKVDAADAERERPVTPEELAKIGALLKEREMTLAALGKWMTAAERNWPIKKMGDLKKWQFESILQSFAKGKE